MGTVLDNVSPSLATRSDALTITSWGYECSNRLQLPRSQNPVSAAWTANLLYFVPFSIAAPIKVSRFFWHNGSTVAGNTDVGIYTLDGTTKLGSTGSTANSGTSTIQIVDVTDFYLPRNSILWLALGSDSGTQTYFRLNLPAAVLLGVLGHNQQSSGWSSGLPSSITFTAPTGTNLPLFGFTGGVVV